MNTVNLARLTATLGALAPIRGVSVPHPGSSNGARIDFDPAATNPQRTAAQAALTGFDWSTASDTSYVQSQNADLHSLLASANGAIGQIDAYLALGSPNNAQNLAAIQALAQDMKAVIKALVKIAQQITS